MWQWVATVMDSTEAQLRLGCALNSGWTGEPVDLPRPSTHLSTTGSSRSSDSPGLESRRSFLSYILSLTRAETNEHGGILPGLDIARMEHVAWVLESLIYLLTHTDPPESR